MMPSMRRALLVLTTVLTGLAAAPAEAARIGDATVRPCKEREWLCGSIVRRLDPAQPKPAIRVHFRYRRATEGATGPPLVAVEGGPGYPSTGSRFEYMDMYGPVLRHRDLLLVDHRGTGRSALIACRELQRATADTTGAPYLAAVRRCADRVNRRYGAGAANRFATAYAVGDFEAVLRTLRLRTIDLYGDSYGTFFVQSYLSRHHARVRSVVLDSAYPIQDLEPWYASSAREGFNAMARVCERSLTCTGSPRERLAELLAEVRVTPLRGRFNGTRERVGPVELNQFLQDSASYPPLLRELDVAVGAALGGDPVPLLRMRAENRPSGSTPAGYFSVGLYTAVACTDYPQLFDMTAPPAERPAQLDAAFAGAPTADLAPFTPQEWISVAATTEPFTTCLNWPVVRGVPPVRAPDARPLPADVPVLVLGGDLDSLTPVADAALVTTPLAERSRVVVLANSFHVASEGATGLAGSTRCSQRLVRAFVRRPSGLETLDARCAAAIPPLHTPSGFPATSAAARAAEVTAGADPGLRVRRAVTIAAEAVGDAAVRGAGRGLRGGRVTVRKGVLRLRGARFTRDARVTGRARLRPAVGGVRATVVVDGPGRPVRVGLRWTERQTTAVATAAGATLSLPAP